MKKMLLGLILIFGLAAHLEAYQFKYFRSLNAATTVINGGFFDGINNPLPPIGGGESWNILLSASGNANMTIQIQVQMSDGSTWVPLMTESIAASASGSTLYYNFLGPFANMRVSITAIGAGSLTADIFVIF